jgi:hypothetical protein
LGHPSSTFTHRWTPQPHNKLQLEVKKHNDPKPHPALKARFAKLFITIYWGWK